MTIVPVADVRSVCSAALQAIGVSFRDSALQVDLLVEADLRGRASHGVMRLPRIINRVANGVANPQAVGEHDWRNPGFLRVDGQAGLGPVVAMSALDAAAARLPKVGVSVIAISNNNHLGMLAWYAEKFAAQGYVLIALSTSEALVHPWGGRSAMIGTNPVAIGVPTDGRAFVLDMATSLVSMGQIHDHAQRDKPIPAGWAIDADGNPTTDPVAAKAGAIAPFGGAKGYALGLAIEVIVAALTTSALGTEVKGTLDDDQDCTKGDVFILIDPSMRPSTSVAISSYLDQIRASGSAESPVMIPGDRAFRERAQRVRHGLSLPDPLWQRLNDLASSQTR